MSLNALISHRALRSALPVGLMLLTLGLSACNSGTTTVTAPPAPVAEGPADSVYDGQDHSWTSGAPTSPQPLALGTGDNTLSYEFWTAATNAWGPIEKDRSNGENLAGDGRTLTLAGQTYARGFGVHAGSSMTFTLGGKCSTFSTKIGVDDEVGSKGSVIFKVVADGVTLFDSGLMTGTSVTKTVNVSVAGKQQLQLVVTDGGNGISYDHADWVSPMLGCTVTVAAPAPVAPAPVPPAAPAPVAPVPVPPAAPTEITYSGPIVITKGGTYSGNWENTLHKPAVLIQTSEPVIIENSNIRSRGNLISGFANRLTVRNTRGYALNPNVAGKAAGRAVNAEEFLNLRVENSYFEGSTGIYARAFRGNAAAGDTIKILRNRFKNTDGRLSDGAGGYNGSYDVVAAILFNNVKRLPNVEIAWNEIINEPGKSRTEDNMNFYLSSGTPSSPFLIHNNYIQGAYGMSPTTEATYAGGGIILGDGLVTDPLDTGYARVYNNQIVSTTNYGIAIAGGVDNQMYNNRVLSSGRLADGQRIPAANVGLYVWDPTGAGQLSPATFANNRMENNVVGWTKVAADGSTNNNPMWFPHCSLNGTLCAGNQNLGIITLDMEKQEYQGWLSKISANNVKVGP
ncbi:NPCBM/NEW2 domain-containing protein [Deinococcus sp. QL22]|uniref:NPCBM/NEW2 domain-containing protein n=1 Tax=Deinococcus sp. QL22 TaxID=2939437 RepID=UPI0020174109|nr:NPCBM/NEW2 domain-containing protein [Deinococcus sp. QL22]UQN09691.1 NPCBM/NEW2 domain-containing protein [Deinococcus sp. QL22]